MEISFTDSVILGRTCSLLDNTDRNQLIASSLPSELASLGEEGFVHLRLPFLKNLETERKVLKSSFGRKSVDIWR